MLHANERSSGHSEVAVDESHVSDRVSKPADSVSFDADVSFSVPFVHRLRRTDNVAAQDFHVLVDLLHGGHDLPRVLLVAERPVVEASGFVSQLAAKLTDHVEVNLVRELYVTEGGEAVKNDSQCVESILQLINEHNLDRRSYVVAVGGGAMLDAVGYATAIAHRGVRLIRIPTTTLAQGDSGVGVKNAINYFNKKNWVGTFSVPWAVINDSAVLHSLSDRDFCSGFSESVKVSLLKSAQEFDWLCRNAERIQRRDQAIVNRAVAVSCQLHLDHITKGGDPFEMLEARPLDFGHWSAHKLEPLTNYEVRHGEAVAIGVAIDCFYSHLKLGLPLSDVHRVGDCLKRMGMPLWHPELEPMERLLGGLEEFRQHLGGRLTITLLQQIGQSCDVHEIDRETMHEALKMLQQWNAASA